MKCDFWSRTGQLLTLISDNYFFITACCSTSSGISILHVSSLSLRWCMSIRLLYDELLDCMRRQPVERECTDWKNYICNLNKVFEKLFSCIKLLWHVQILELLLHQMSLFRQVYVCLLGVCLTALQTVLTFFLALFLFT